MFNLAVIPTSIPSFRLIPDQAREESSKFNTVWMPGRACLVPNTGSGRNAERHFSFVIPAKAGIQRGIIEQTAGDLYFGKQTKKTIIHFHCLSPISCLSGEKP